MERYRIVADVGGYYVTFTVVDWLPVFINESACKIITDSLNFCVKQKALRVNAYVIMPTTCTPSCLIWNSVLNG